jgi:hypothetical protein
MPSETETVTITQTAPDGTETKIEITQTPPEGTDESLVEEIIEAIFDDTNGDGEITAEDFETGNEIEPNDVTYETQDSTAFDSTEPIQSEQTATESVEPEIFIPVNYDGGTTDFNPAAYDVSFVPTVENTDAGTVDTSATDTAEAVELAEQQAQADAARDAQQAADDFVAAGDYEAAAEARQAAEDAAWEAGDNSMLDGSNATELDNAAWEQDNADYYRAQQEELTAKGDYEGAAEAADKVVENTSDADWYASGDDHSTEARNDAYALDNAVDAEKDAEWYANNAQEFAEQGDVYNAEVYAEQAGESLAEADDFATSTTDGTNFDPSSQVESGGSYDAATDYSAYDAGTDFSADAGADYSSATDYSTYDAGTVDTSTTDYSTE